MVSDQTQHVWVTVQKLGNVKKAEQYNISEEGKGQGRGINRKDKCIVVGRQGP